MTKRADIGAKRLISLDPTAWVRWLLHDDDLLYSPRRHSHGAR